MYAIFFWVIKRKVLAQILGTSQRYFQLHIALPSPLHPSILFLTPALHLYPPPLLTNPSISIFFPIMGNFQYIHHFLRRSPKPMIPDNTNIHMFICKTRNYDTVVNSKQVLRSDPGRAYSRPFRNLWQTDRPTNGQTGSQGSYTFSNKTKTKQEFFETLRWGFINQEKKEVLRSIFFSFIDSHLCCELMAAVKLSISSFVCLHNLGSL